MTIRVILTGAVIALSTVAASSTANAGIVNYNGSDVNMGSVAIGQTGSITNFYSIVPGNFGITPPPYSIASDIFGTLPSMSKITFTYAAHNMPTFLGGELSSNGSYGPNAYQGDAGYGSYYGNASANSSDGATAHGYFNGATSLPLVLATANLMCDYGTTTIQNNNTSIHYTTSTFATLFSGAISSFPACGTLTYRVSAVPLPASFPLFASLIAAMFWFARFHRSRKNVAFTA